MEHVIFAVVINPKFLLSKAESFMKRGKCKDNHCSSMSNSAWFDLNNGGIKLKLHDKCPNPKCNCQKLKTFTTHQYMLESGSIESKLQKIFDWTQTVWNNLLKPALNIACPYIGMAVCARTKNSQIGEATSDILKSTTGSKIISLTDMHGQRLRLKIR